MTDFFHFLYDLVAEQNFLWVLLIPILAFSIVGLLYQTLASCIKKHSLKPLTDWLIWVLLLGSLALNAMVFVPPWVEWKKEKAGTVYDKTTFVVKITPAGSHNRIVTLWKIVTPDGKKDGIAVKGDWYHLEKDLTYATDIQIHKATKTFIVRKGLLTKPD